MNDLRKIVRAARELQNVKIKEIAEKIEKNKAGIANWERGIATLSKETIMKICQEIGVDCERKKFLKRDEIFYFHINYDKDIEYLREISKIMNINEIVFFENFVLCHDNDTDNFYVLILKEKEKNVIRIKNEIKSIFSNAIYKEESASEEILKKLQEKKLTKEDLNDFLYYTYCYRSRKIVVRATDNSITYVHEIPIATVLRDFYKYIQYETNEERKRKHLQDLVMLYCTMFEKVDKEEYEKRLEKVLLNFNLK